MTTAEFISHLLLKHLQGSLSAEEQEQLALWLQQSPRNQELLNAIDNEEHLRQQLQLLREAQEQEQAVFEKIQRMRNLPVTAVVKRGLFTRKWMWAAASLLLLAGVGVYLFTINHPAATREVAVAGVHDVEPGKTGAILTLADGRQVVLDSLQNGVVAVQNGAAVTLQNGGLAYNASGNTGSAPVYNTLSTPRGRQFELSLPDGTKVWLNAASSLQYPTLFSGKERRVLVTGEAYFEVAASSALPFIVVTEKAMVQVLGTSFNINAYTNEGAFAATLVNGSVKVAAGTSEVLLKPGQQAQVNNSGAAQPVRVVSEPDMGRALAWKNGYFNFEDVALEDAMRQLERWYDIQVTYEKNIPDIHFGGKLSRDMSLKGLLKSLEEADVHFRIEEGRKLIVLP